MRKLIALSKWGRHEKWIEKQKRIIANGGKAPEWWYKHEKLEGGK